MNEGPPVDPLGASPDPPDAAYRRDCAAASGLLQPSILAAIAAGGMLGASARLGIAWWLPTRPGRFPWSTWWTNLSGSFLLGLLLVVLLEGFAARRHLRPFLATGILAAFTTMSTYQVETALLLRDGHPVTGVAYGTLSLAVGIALAYAGTRVGRRFAPTREGSP